MPLMLRSPLSATELAVESLPHSSSPAIGQAGSCGVMPRCTAWLMMATNVASHGKETQLPRQVA